VKDEAVMIRHADDLSFDADSPSILRFRGVHVTLMGLERSQTTSGALQIELEFQNTGTFVYCCAGSSIVGQSA